MKSRGGPRRLGQAKMNLFYLPAVLLFLVFVIYPFIQGGFLSLTNWNGYSQSYKMVGLKNYVRLFTDGNVGTAFLNTLIYGFGSTLLQNVLGLALALFLNGKFRGRSVLRTVIYLPVMIAPLIMGYVMYFFFSYNRGAINDIVLALGGQMVDWMASGPRAVAIMTVVNALQFVGVSMVIYLAGLQNIPQMYYEAAAMDGIGKAAQLRYITLPLLMPAIQSAVVVNLIGGLKLFDIIMALTSGGPGYASHSLSTLVHRTYFGSENAGYASAIGLVSFLLIMLIGTLVTRYFTKKEVEM
ncbi:carbohydrate ABC transporter permease [Pseudoflavonifractor phocaeensis]|uniref:carbohydrate ABC transporter permease n=1 Tax=Pseudoflavonifractor phocaeensis TaxID=1870988 RepID=UPI00352204A1